MIHDTYTDGNGIVRSIDGKVFGKELRIYRVFGDVTDREGLEEMCQEAAIRHNCESVTLKL